MDSRGSSTSSAIASPALDPPKLFALDRSGLIHLSIVWVVWGSTYLAIRMAVREGTGFPPFTMACMRVFLGSALLFGWARFRGLRLRATRGELLTLALTGCFLWLGGNGLLTFAERRVHSGYAALVVATAPVWAALIEGLLDRRRPTLLFMGSLGLSIAGIALLSSPGSNEAPLDGVTIAALLLAPLSWAGGTVLMRRQPIKLDPLAGAAYQHAFAAIGFASMALACGERIEHPEPQAWLAWGYLALIGAFAFTSYVQAVKRLPVGIVMTYAYVNPVIAVALGWALLNEEVTKVTFAGAALVLAGVAGIFHEKARAASTQK